jgi:CRISPR-associated protein Cmr3
MTSVFIEPCDVVFFRDDLPFGVRGTQVGRCQFLPRPSVIAGALRTRVLASQGVDFDGFRQGADLPEAIAREIGHVRNRALEVGTFRLAGLYLGERNGDGGDVAYFRVGRDLVGPGKKGDGKGRRPRLLRPAPEDWMPGPSSLGGLRPLAITPGLEPVGGWLDAVSFVRYLAGDPPETTSLEESGILDWDHRVGIGLDPEARTVDEGRLFSSQGAVMRAGWGFVADVEGCSLLPTAGLVRLGGDGRMARLSRWAGAAPDWSAPREAVIRSRRFRWVLQTPAIFSGGWLPRSLREAADRWFIERDGFRARLVSVAIAAPELAGGWDLIRRGPKPFRRMVPAGSVYWFDIETGSGEAAWALFHGQSVSDEKAQEGFGLVHLGGW